MAINQAKLMRSINYIDDTVTVDKSSSAVVNEKIKREKQNIAHRISLHKLLRYDMN